MKLARYQFRAGARRHEPIGATQPIRHPKRSLRRWTSGTVGLSFCAMSVAMAPAMATDTDGSVYLPMTVNGSTHVGTTEWHGLGDYLHFNLDTGSFSTSRCVTSWYDWVTDDGGHYDARAIRVCNPGAYRGNPQDWSEPNFTRDVTGVQKLGKCMWNQTDQVQNACKDWSGSSASVTTTVGHFPNAVTYAWVRFEDNHIDIVGSNYPLEGDR